MKSDGYSKKTESENKNRKKENNNRYKRALKQINSSKIFLEYLYKNYKEHFDKKFDISQALENAQSIYIYPASISEKKPTFALDTSILRLKKIEIDLDGNAKLGDIRSFFGI